MANLRLERILVPTDLSTFGVVALRFAELFRERLGATATLLYANEPLYPITAFDSSLGIPWDGEEVHRQLQADLRDYLGRYIPDSAAYDVRVADEIAPTAICDTAKQMNADLIIMGTHSRAGWRRALLGSVAARVSRETDVPLLTINAAVAAADKVSIASILCPVNFTTVAHDALQYASFLAAKFDAQLTVLNVEEETPAIDVKRDFAGWVDSAIRDRCNYRQLVVEGGAAEAVLETGNQYRTDLIVIGAQHRRFSDATVIGTTTERVMRFAWQPVLTVIRPPAQRDAEIAA